MISLMGLNVRRIWALYCALFGVGIVLGSIPAAARQPQLMISSDRDLQFGSFAVIDRGYRTISPTGGVFSSGIFSTTSGDTSPARFTISYDRGSNRRRRLDLRIQLVLSQASVVNQQGIVARVSAYQSDLPGAPNIQPGQIVEVTIPNCVQRVCSTTFNVGARLDIERRYGGGKIQIPIPADVVLVSIR